MMPLLIRKKQFKLKYVMKLKQIHNECKCDLLSFLLLLLLYNFFDLYNAILQPQLSVLGLFLSRYVMTYVYVLNVSNFF